MCVWKSIGISVIFHSLGFFLVMGSARRLADTQNL